MESTLYRRFAGLPLPAQAQATQANILAAEEALRAIDAGLFDVEAEIANRLAYLSGRLREQLQPEGGAVVRPQLLALSGTNISIFNVLQRLGSLTQQQTTDVAQYLKQLLAISSQRYMLAIRDGTAQALEESRYDVASIANNVHACKDNLKRREEALKSINSLLPIAVDYALLWKWLEAPIFAMPGSKDQAQQLLGLENALNGAYVIANILGASGTAIDLLDEHGPLFFGAKRALSNLKHLHALKSVYTTMKLNPTVRAFVLGGSAFRTEIHAVDIAEEVLFELFCHNVEQEIQVMYFWRRAGFQ